MNTLKLNRYKGEELFNISEAEIYLSNEKTELSLDFKTGPCLSSPFDDTNVSGEITGEFWIFDLKISNIKELEGQTFYIKDGYENQNYSDSSSLCYYEPASISENIIEFIKYTPESFLVKITANTCDVNHYDNSKPETKIEVLGYFKL